MIEFICLTYAFLITFAAGKLIFEIKFLSIKDEPPGIKIPLYFIIGSIVLSLYMFVLYLVKIRCTVLSISLPFILYLAYICFKYYRSVPQATIDLYEYFNSLLTTAARKQNLLFTVTAMLFLAVFIVIMLDNTIIPIFIGDAYIHWFFKAKAIFTARTIPADILTDNTFYYSALDYPLLVPLNIAWLSICLGRWSDTITKTFFTLQYCFAAIFFYFSLKKHMNSLLALAGTFITFTIPHIIGDITTGYVDINVGLFALISVILLYWWFNNRNKMNFFFLSAICIGATAWTKNDGIALFAAVALTLSIYLAANIAGRRISIPYAVSGFFAYILTAALIFMPFKILIALWKVENHMIVQLNQLFSVLGNLNRLSYILNYYFYEFFLDNYLWLYFWIFLIMLLFVNRKNIRGTSSIYLLFFEIISICTYFYVYMITALGVTPDKLINNLELSLDRVMLGLAPAAGFLLFSSFASPKDKRPDL